jgi:glucose/arabinose dehydrogenase
MSIFRGVASVCGVLGALGLTTGWAAGPDAFPRFTVSTYAAGLQQPDHLAFHPATGELYVSEELAGRISVIRNGRAETVIERDFTVTDDLAPDQLDAERPAPTGYAINWSARKGSPSVRTDIFMWWRIRRAGAC